MRFPALTLNGSTVASKPQEASTAARSYTTLRVAGPTLMPGGGAICADVASAAGMQEPSNLEWHYGTLLFSKNLAMRGALEGDVEFTADNSSAGKPQEIANLEWKRVPAKLVRMPSPSRLLHQKWQR